MDSEEQFSERAIRFIGWLDRHKTPVIAVLVVVLALAGIWGYSKWQQGQREKKASQELLEVETTGPRSAQQQTNVTSEDYLEIAEKYPSSRSGQRARLLGAKQLFTDGDYKKAQQEFEAFLSKNPTDVLAVQAAYGIAASLEAQGKTEAAIKQYQKVLDRFPESSVAPQAKFSLARLKERQGKNQEALALYEEVSQLGSGGANYWASQADQRKTRLLDEHPKLEETTNQVSSVTNTNLEGSSNLNIPDSQETSSGGDGDSGTDGTDNAKPSDDTTGEKPASSTSDASDASESGSQE